MLERFAAGIAPLRPAGRLGLAVSGGPDSMALLWLAHSVLGDAVKVATVNHGLRAESADECALVAAFCEIRGIPCQTLGVEVAEGNVQDRARAARYAALGQWAEANEMTSIATAHHADDQAETMVMRLNRGSGLAGLVGIRSATRLAGCPVPVIRPLLGFRKSELRALVERRAIPFVEDPSNRDESYDRVRVRKGLAQADWLDPIALARSATHLEEAEAALESLAGQLWEDEAKVEQERVSVPVVPQLDITARLVARAIGVLGGTVPQGQVIAYLKTGAQRGNLAGVIVDRQGARYVCAPEPPRRKT